jgi:hypothetical protein
MKRREYNMKVALIMAIPDESKVYLSRRVFVFTIAVLVKSMPPLVHLT